MILKYTTAEIRGEVNGEAQFHLDVAFRSGAIRRRWNLKAAPPSTDMTAYLSKDLAKLTGAPVIWIKINV